MFDYRCPACERKGEEGKNLSFRKLCNAYGLGRGIFFFCNNCQHHFSVEIKEHKNDVFKSGKDFKLALALRKKYPFLLTETCCAVFK